MAFIAYLLCTAAGYAAGYFLPESAASPYVPLLVSYHLFVLFLALRAAVTEEQKLGLSMPLPMATLSHLAFVGGMIGMVMGRHQVPMFGLLKYVVPGLAPFEVKWLFEGRKQGHMAAEPDPMPQGTMDEYDEFLAYMRDPKRRFQRTGRSVKDEFAAWREDRNKKRAAATAEATSA
jgi:hypothetical protein